MAKKRKLLLFSDMHERFTGKMAKMYVVKMPVLRINLVFTFTIQFDNEINEMMSC